MQEDIFDEEKSKKADMLPQGEERVDNPQEDIFEEEKESVAKKDSKKVRGPLIPRTILPAVGLVFFLILIFGALFMLSYDVKSPLKTRGQISSFPIEAKEKDPIKTAGQIKETTVERITKKESRTKEGRTKDARKVLDQPPTAGNAKEEKSVQTAAQVIEPKKTAVQIKKETDSTATDGQKAPHVPEKALKKEEKQKSTPDGENKERETVKTGAQLVVGKDTVVKTKQETDTRAADNQKVPHVLEKEKKKTEVEIKESAEIKEKGETEKGRKYVIPYLVHYIRRSAFQKAASTCHKDLRKFSNAYSIRLEVVCQNKSIQTAFQEGKFNPRLFILPKKLNGRSCYAVFWGLYSSHREARKALRSVPPFFNEQKFPPVPVRLGQYL